MIGSVTQRCDLEIRFAQRCKTVRELRNLTQQRLADRAGVHQSAVSRIESLDRPVRLGEAVKICEVLRVDLTEMVSEGSLQVITVQSS